MERDGLSRFEEAGLAGLVRAGERGEWFSGHFGAALVSGGALLRDPALPAPAREALRRVLERLLSRHPDWFGPLDDDGASASPAAVVEALEAAVAVSRTSGHPTIYAVAGLRCLAREPARATGRVVEGLVRIHRSAHTGDDRGRYYGTADYFTVEVVPGDAVPPLREVRDAVEAGFRAWDDLAPDADIDGRRYFFAGEKIHLVTHAHALACLEEMGHRALARTGLEAASVQLKLSRTPRRARRPLPTASRLTPFDAAFWTHDGIDVWHKLKLAEASVRFLPSLPDEMRVAAQERLGVFWSLFGIDPETAGSG